MSKRPWRGSNNILYDICIIILLKYFFILFIKDYDIKLFLIFSSVHLISTLVLHTVQGELFEQFSLATVPGYCIIIYHRHVIYYIYYTSYIHVFYDYDTVALLILIL